MESEIKITDLLSILERQNEAEEDKDLVKRRRAEVNNILCILKMTKEAQDILVCRDRLKLLVAFPKTAGQLDVAEGIEENGLKRFYSDSDDE